MNANAMDQHNGLSETEALEERVGLAALPAKLFWLVVTLLCGGFVLDSLGWPASPAVWLFVAGGLVGAACEALMALVARGKLEHKTSGTFYTGSKWLSSLGAGGVLAVAALAFGEAPLQAMGPVLASGMGLVAGLLAASMNRMPIVVPGPVAGDAATAAMKAPRPLSDSDRQLALYHEAGHALTLAMLPDSWREGAAVQIDGYGSTFTSVPTMEEGWKPAPFRRWEMLMLLGGPVATDVAYGIAMEGGASDLRRWRHAAMAMLTAERAEGWTLAPETELELTANQRLLKELEVTQTQVLKGFFERNRIPYQRLVAHLEQHGEATPEDIDYLLADVVMGRDVESALGI